MNPFIYPWCQQNDRSIDGSSLGCSTSFSFITKHISSSLHLADLLRYLITSSMEFTSNGTVLIFRAYVERFYGFRQHRSDEALCSSCNLIRHLIDVRRTLGQSILLCSSNFANLARTIFILESIMESKVSACFSVAHNMHNLHSFRHIHSFLRCVHKCHNWPMTISP